MNRMQAAEQMRKAIQMYAANLTEEEALVIASVYPEWNGNGINYKTGTWLRYGYDNIGDVCLYQVLQDHTSQPQWTPDSATSLYKRVGVSEDGTPKWVQPVGATDAYNKGDIVEYNGKKYISTIDANVWAPDVHGWEVYTGGSTESGGSEVVEPETPPVTPTETIKDFVQPTGAHDAYAVGDKVRYNGKIYESLIASNVYSPDAYPAGWKEITE